MEWAAVRARYLAIADKSGANLAWHLAIGYYVADRWIAEGVMLQDQAYDSTLTDPVWDSHLTLSALEKLEQDSLDALATHMRRAQTNIDRAVIEEALLSYGTPKTGDLAAALTAHQPAASTEIKQALAQNDRISWAWTRKTMLEGPLSAFGIVLFGFAITVAAAIFSPLARDALGDLGGALTQVFVAKSDN